jgi:hypothetical protein
MVRSLIPFTFKGIIWMFEPVFILVMYNVSDVIDAIALVLSVKKE